MKYPNGIKQQNTNKNNIKYDNRGMTLEKDLNDTNQYYVDMNKARALREVKAIVEQIKKDWYENK
jgi:maltodextrin utilization protein YvdJ